MEASIWGSSHLQTGAPGQDGPSPGPWWGVGESTSESTWPVLTGHPLSVSRNSAGDHSSSQLITLVIWILRACLSQGPRTHEGAGASSFQGPSGKHLWGPLAAPSRDPEPGSAAPGKAGLQKSTPPALNESLRLLNFFAPGTAKQGAVSEGSGPWPRGVGIGPPQRSWPRHPPKRSWLGVGSFHSQGLDTAPVSPAGRSSAEILLLPLSLCRAPAPRRHPFLRPAPPPLRA